MMTAAAGGLLLLVCANVANLLLSVTLKRRRDHDRARSAGSVSRPARTAGTDGKRPALRIGPVSSRSF